MGGDWEVPIKSVKRTLKTFTRDRLFTKDALDIFFCKKLLAIISSITKH